MITKADIKYIVSLQLKKQRQKYGQFVVEGEKSIAELLKSPLNVDRLYATGKCLNDNTVLSQFKSVVEISEKELGTISVHQTPQGALALVDIPDTKLNADDFNQPLSIALDNIQDPGNLGTIIRIADWYGIHTIICSRDCTDVYNPKCINSTMGSFCRVNVFYEDIAEVSNKYNQAIIAATLDGNNIHQLKEKIKGLIVIGNEGHGIRPDILENARYSISIPRLGGAESLNAAVSTAIIVDNLVR